VGGVSGTTDTGSGWLDRLLGPFGATGGFLDRDGGESGGTGADPDSHHRQGFGLGPQLWTDLTSVGGVNDPHRGSSSAGGADTQQVTGIGAAFGNLDGGNKDPLKDIFKPTDHEPKH
jgi:hypothetical protein